MSERTLEMKTGLFSQHGNGTSVESENVVEQYYRPLYQFAFSLTRSEADACDLTQHTFYTWKLKGEQLRDATKVKAWLFTTLHRAFLQTRRKESRFPHFELELVDSELPSISPQEVSRLDCDEVMGALEEVDDIFRTPLTLFYLQDCPYKEIASMLDIPLGTVKSRIARGIMQLQKLLTGEVCRDQELVAA
jgi:RNA polymerase sigma-70 factor (ECF subfamily)